MLSPRIEHVLNVYRKSSGAVLALPSQLLESDIDNLRSTADTFAAVKELQVVGACDRVWVADGLVAFAARLPNLSRLTLNFSSKLGDTGLRTLVERLAAPLPGLTALYLGGCSQLTDTGVEAVAKGLTGLTALHLDSCTRLTDAGVRAVAQGLTGLTALHLGGCDQLTDAGVRAVAQGFPGLTTLDLRGCKELTDAGVRAVAQGLPGLTTLDLESCRRLTDAGVRAVAQGLPGLTTLDLRGCTQLTDAGVEAVAQGLHGLTTLHLGGCTRLTDASARAVAQELTGLTALDFGRCNQLTDAGVRAVAKGLTGLTALYLKGCDQLTDMGVEAVAQGLHGLAILDLGGCKELTDASARAVAQELTGLTALDFGRCNQLTDAGVRAVAKGLTGLTALDLRGCEELTDVGARAVAKGLRGLTALHLGGCTQLTDAGVKAVAQGLPGLTTLHLGRSRQLTDVGVEAVAQGLPGLTTLDLAGCSQLTDVGVEAVAKGLTGLTALHLGGCRQLTDVGVRAVAQGLTGLITLELGGCDRLTDTGARAVAKGLTGLTALDLRGCEELTDAGVEAVAKGLTGLTALDLGGCKKLTDAGVEAVAKGLTGLTALHLGGCKELTDKGAEAVAKGLTGLTALDLERCDRLTDAGVRAVAQGLIALHCLKLDGIPSLRAPRELLQNSFNPAAVRIYYSRAEDEGKRQLNEAKLIVVGNEAVGKSALVDFLIKDQSCTDSAKTEGVTILDRINVAKWDVEGRNEGESSLRLNVWDFGGQEVLYETHRFFLTARSLYLIVLEARRENIVDADTVLHDWMRAIRNRGGEEVPVIVVVNKAESPHNLLLDETRLRKEYPAIRGFVRTSCCDPGKHREGGKGIAELRQLIFRIVRTDLPHVRDWFPESYFQVKEEVRELARRESMLSTASYVMICTKATVTSELEQESLLALLDDIGVVVKHSEATLLDPNWLTTAVYRVLTHADVVQSGGEFAMNDLGRLLAGLQNVGHYPERWWKYIADMMVRFNLSFELSDQPERYLVPEQLPRHEPELGWKEENCLRFRYDYDSLPRGLLPRFIVEMHRYLTPKRTAWLSGVVLTLDGCQILVRADRKNRRVHIFVDKAPNSQRGVLAVVRNAFAKVHELYGDLKVKAMVPVFVTSVPDAAIEYEQLITSERLGVETVAVPGGEHPLIVSALLSGVSPERNIARSHTRKEELRSDVEPSSISSTRPTKSWWFPLIGPAVAAGISATLAGMVLYGADGKMTVLLAVAVTIFALIYMIQVRMAWRSAHWPKPLMHICATAAVASGLLPTIKFLVDVSVIGKLELLLDNAPIGTIVFILGAVAFGGLQVYRERHGLEETG